MFLRKNLSVSFLKAFSIDWMCVIITRLESLLFYRWVFFVIFESPQGWVTSGQVRHTAAWSGSSCHIFLSWQGKYDKMLLSLHYDIMTGSASGDSPVCVVCSDHHLLNSVTSPAPIQPQGKVIGSGRSWPQTGEDGRPPVLSPSPRVWRPGPRGKRPEESRRGEYCGNSRFNITHYFPLVAAAVKTATLRGFINYIARSTMVEPSFGIISNLGGVLIFWQWNIMRIIEDWAGGNWTELDSLALWCRSTGLTSRLGR